MLTLSTDVFHLSFINNGLTIYFKSKSEVSPEALCTPAFAADTLRITLQNKFNDGKIIHTNEDEHSLYHKDEFSSDREHIHLKFNFTLAEEHFEFIANTLEKYALITEDEKMAFLKKLKNKCENMDEQYEDKDLSVQFSR